MMRFGKAERVLSLFLSLALLLSACGGGASASTMCLRKTEGTVRVSDDKGTDLEIREDLSLYSGYDLRTREESYAWIDLDGTKLTKMDQETRAEIEKDGRNLKITVKKGSLFFNVTEPLEDGETMEIRVSTMAVGIRGTCGWVEAPEDGETMRVYLLEGRLACSVDGGDRETILAGEMAVMTEDGDIEVSSFTDAAIPAFVREELEEDEALRELLLPETAGLDPVQDQQRRAALLETLDAASRVQYAGLFDVDGDSVEDLLLLSAITTEYDGEIEQFCAYCWDGAQARAIDLGRTGDETMDSYLSTGFGAYGVCRERTTGRLYVCYNGEIVGGWGGTLFVSPDDYVFFSAPFAGDGEGVDWDAFDLENEEYQAAMAERFEFLQDLMHIRWGRMMSEDGSPSWSYVKDDFTFTVDQVRQALAS